MAAQHSPYYTNELAINKNYQLNNDRHEEKKTQTRFGLVKRGLPTIIQRKTTAIKRVLLKVIKKKSIPFKICRISHYYDTQASAAFTRTPTAIKPEILLLLIQQKSKHSNRNQ